MEESKIWWQSRTILTGLAGLIFAILTAFDIVPVGLTPEFLLETVLGVVSLMAIIFRTRAVKKVTLVAPAA